MDGSLLPDFIINIHSSGESNQRYKCHKSNSCHAMLQRAPTKTFSGLIDHYLSNTHCISWACRIIPTHPNMGFGQRQLLTPICLHLLSIRTVFGRTHIHPRKFLKTYNLQKLDVNGHLF